MDDASSATAFRNLVPPNFSMSRVNGTLGLPKFLSGAAGTAFTSNASVYTQGPSGVNLGLVAAGPQAFVGFFRTTDPAPGNTLLWSTYPAVDPSAINLYNLGGHFAMFFRNSGGTNTGIISGPVINDGYPHMFVVNYDTAAETYSGWIDGTQFASGTLPAGQLVYGSGFLHFFSLRDTLASQSYIGDACDFAIFHANLNVTQQQLILYAAGIGSFPPFIPPSPNVPSGLPANPPTAFSCTTIADVCNALTQLEFKIDHLALQQTFPAPPSLSFGTPIAGVSGSGNVDPSGLLGLQVQATTIPAQWGRTTDSPPRYLPDLGELQLMYGGSGPYASNKRIAYANQVELFDTHNVVEAHYSFRPGVVVTLTPIHRGP